MAKQMTKVELLEDIILALKEDEKFPRFGCTLDHSTETLSITFVETKQSFNIDVKEVTYGDDS